MRRKHWIMLYSLLLPYFFALVLCPMISNGGPLNVPRKFHNRQQRDGVFYTLPVEKWTRISYQRSSSGWVVDYTRTKSFRKRLRKATKRFVNFLLKMKHDRSSKKVTEEMLIYRHLFHLFDIDNDQNVTFSEFSSILQMLRVTDRSSRRMRHGRRKGRRKWRNRGMNRYRQGPRKHRNKPI